MNFFKLPMTVKTVMKQRSTDRFPMNSRHSTNWPSAVQVVGDYAYVGGIVVREDGEFGRLDILDITDPAQPVPVGGLDTESPVFGIHVLGQQAFLAETYSGLEIVDVSTPRQPLRLGKCDTGGMAIDVR